MHGKQSSLLRLTGALRCAGKRVPAATATGATASAVNPVNPANRPRARPRFRSVTDGETAYQVGAERHRL